MEALTMSRGQRRVAESNCAKYLKQIAKKEVITTKDFDRSKATYVLAGKPSCATSSYELIEKKWRKALWKE